MAAVAKAGGASTAAAAEQEQAPTHHRGIDMLRTMLQRQAQHVARLEGKVREVQAEAKAAAEEQGHEMARLVEKLEATQASYKALVEKQEATQASYKALAEKQEATQASYKALVEQETAAKATCLGLVEQEQAAKAIALRLVEQEQAKHDAYKGLAEQSEANGAEERQKFAAAMKRSEAAQAASEEKFNARLAESDANHAKLCASLTEQEALLEAMDGDLKAQERQLKRCAQVGVQMQLKIARDGGPKTEAARASMQMLQQLMDSTLHESKHSE